MFGKLPAEPSATLSPDGEITPEANPWAVRWMEDLEALQPYDERGVVQRMVKDVRALFLDRELAADFVAIDVSVLRLQSLSTQVPPWDFREEVGHPMEVSQEGVPQWRCCFDDQCEAKFESFKALATHVLRHHRQWRRCLDLYSPISVLCVWRCTGIEKRLIVLSCLLFVVGPVVIDLG